MSDSLDDFFQGGGPPPEASLPDRLPGIRRLARVGALLSFLGPFCFTGVPGAAVALWAWYRADEELERLEAGALDAARHEDVHTTRRAAFRGVLLAGVMLAVQLVLFGAGVYDRLAEAFLGGLGTLLQLGGAPVPPGLAPPVP